MNRHTARTGASIPWLRTALLSTLLATLSGIAVILITGNLRIALALVAIQTALFFLIFVVGMWWADRR